MYSLKRLLHSISLQQVFDVTLRLKHFDDTKRAHMARYNMVQTSTKRHHSIGGA